MIGWYHGVFDGFRFGLFIARLSIFILIFNNIQSIQSLNLCLQFEKQPRILMMRVHRIARIMASVALSTLVILRNSFAPFTLV